MDNLWQFVFKDKDNQFTIDQLTIAGIAENNSTFNTQHSTLPKVSINVQLTVINVQRY